MKITVWNTKAERAIAAIKKVGGIPQTPRPDEKGYVTISFSGCLVEDVEEAFAKSEAAAVLGSMTSEKKAAAARRNGRKGGRPRKERSN